MLVEGFTDSIWCGSRRSESEGGRGHGHRRHGQRARRSFGQPIKKQNSGWPFGRRRADAHVVQLRLPLRWWRRGTHSRRLRGHTGRASLGPRFSGAKVGVTPLLTAQQGGPREPSYSLAVSRPCSLATPLSSWSYRRKNKVWCLAPDTRSSCWEPAGLRGNAGSPLVPPQVWLPGSKETAIWCTFEAQARIFRRLLFMFVIRGLGPEQNPDFSNQPKTSGHWPRVWWSDV